MCTQQPVMRRLVTRLIGLVPSLIIAAAGGRAGLNGLLIASQVTLSIVLPFVTLPLIYLTSSSAIMSVRVEAPNSGPASDANPEVAGQGQESTVDYSSGKLATGAGVVIWLIMVAANAYVLVTLALGEDS